MPWWGWTIAAVVAYGALVFVILCPFVCGAREDRAVEARRARDVRED
jgi:hypothetical protein